MPALMELMACKVNLEGDCTDACREFSKPLYDQLASGRYDTCSTLEIPETLNEWLAEHRTARKRTARAERLGYHAGLILRHERADEIYEINMSTDERQGRPMTAGYRERPSTTPDPYYCPRHGVHAYGVVTGGGRLRAYLWVYRSGELALVSQILGHDSYLKDDVMYLLFRFALECEIPLGGTFVYNRHDSGTEGLRYFKSKLGFEPRYVRWAL